MTNETSPALTPLVVSRRNNLNFLRLVLAALVILSHATELVDGNRHREILTCLFHTLSFGDLAVDGFFILSGYLIVQSWLRSASPANYLQKRVLRIYPGFIAAFLISVFIVGPLGAASAQAYFAQTNWRHLLIELVTLNRPLTAPVFEGLPYPFVNGAMWTIVYEFGCYLLVMALGMAGLLRKRFLIGALFVIALLLQLFISRHALHLTFPIAYIGSPLMWPRFLTFFLAGICFYLFRDCIAYRPHWACLALILLFFALFKNISALLFLPACGAYLLLYVGLHPVEPLSKVGMKTDLSYGLYLYGYPVQMLLIWYARHSNPWLLFLAALGISAGLAWLSWNLVEKPAQALKRRVGVSRAVPASA